jgi:hypothetical protein
MMRDDASLHDKSRARRSKKNSDEKNFSRFFLRINFLLLLFV